MISLHLLGILEGLISGIFLRHKVIIIEYYCFPSFPTIPPHPEIIDKIWEMKDWNEGIWSFSLYGGMLLIMISMYFWHFYYDNSYYISRELNKIIADRLKFCHSLSFHCLLHIRPVLSFNCRNSKCDAHRGVVNTYCLSDSCYIHLWRKWNSESRYDSQ